MPRKVSCSAQLYEKFKSSYSRRAKVNAQGGAYSSAPHAGTAGGYETRGFTLKRGANVQIIDNSGATALHVAAYTDPSRYSSNSCNKMHPTSLSVMFLR